MPDLFSDLLQAAGRFASFVQTAPQGVPERVWREVGPWLSHLVAKSTAKWIPIISAGFECEVLYPDRSSPTGWVGCSNQAVTVCDCCAHRTCLHHCRIDANGDAICFECVAEARRAVSAKPRHPPHGDPRRPPAGHQHAAGKQQAPPAKMTRAQALKVFGLKSSADAEEVKSAYRKLALRWHPDRHQGEEAKRKATARFLQIQTAYDVLSRSTPGA